MPGIKIMIRYIKKIDKYHFSLYLAIFVFALSLLYISVKVIFPNTPSQGFDFRLIWLAGRLWSDGQNPYDIDIFKASYLAVFGLGPNTHFWVYPPSWSCISVAFSIFPFSVAEFLWRLANYLALFGIVAITGLLLYDWKICCLRDPRLYLGATYCYLLQATPVVISIGQTSILSTFGFILALYGMRQSSLLLSVLGLYILSLKPQIALVFFISLLVGGYFRIVVLAVLLSIASSGIAFLFSGIGQNIKGFLINLNRYSSDSNFSANLPPDLTGLSNLLDYFGYEKLSSPKFILMAVIVGLVMGLVMRVFGITFRDWEKLQLPLQKKWDPPILWIITMLSSTFFVMPLHTYDAVWLSPVAILSLYCSRLTWLLLLPGLLMIFRDGNLAQITGIYHPDVVIFQGSLLVSLGAFILLIGSVIAITISLKYSRRFQQNEV